MIMHISYSEGYADALRDICSWFDNHRFLYDFLGKIPTKRKVELVISILRHFKDNKDRFFMEKECYELKVIIPKDGKKSIEIISDKQALHLHKKTK